MKAVGDIVYNVLFGILVIPVCVLALCIVAIALLVGFPFLLLGAIKQNMEEQEETRRLIRYGNSLCHSHYTKKGSHD